MKTLAERLAEKYPHQFREEGGRMFYRGLEVIAQPDGKVTVQGKTRRKEFDDYWDLFRWIYNTPLSQMHSLEVE